MGFNYSLNSIFFFFFLHFYFLITALFSMFISCFPHTILADNNIGDFRCYHLCKDICLQHRRQNLYDTLKHFLFLTLTASFRLLHIHPLLHIFRELCLTRGKGAVKNTNNANGKSTLIFHLLHILHTCEMFQTHTCEI